MSAQPPERVVDVGLGERAYPIIIGAGVLDTLGERLRERIRSNRVAVITDSNVGPLYADQAAASLRGAGFDPTVCTVPAGDATKSLDQLARLYDAMADARMDRTSPVVALGGGVIGDLTGFLAATWLRGIPLVQCPTTIEADVDASVGGKTAVNHRSGKNMIGAFYQPRFVLIDTLTLRTLTERDFRAGLAESIKHAVIRDAGFFDWHERMLETMLANDPETMGELVARNVRIKADVVAADEREVSGMRALLNFGHTIGHAIESVMARRGDPWRHGEAVAAGMVAASAMSVVAGRLDQASADRITAWLKRAGLPVEAPLADARDELRELLLADKKVAEGRIRFVLADAIGRATLYDDIQPAWIEAGLDSVLTG